MKKGGIVILDFGSQYNQLIARRVREMGVYAEVVPFHEDIDKILAREPKGIILSGGPASVYTEGAPSLDKPRLPARPHRPRQGLPHPLHLHRGRHRPHELPPRRLGRHVSELLSACMRNSPVHMHGAVESVLPKIPFALSALGDEIGGCAN